MTVTCFSNDRARCGVKRFGMEDQGRGVSAGLRAHTIWRGRKKEGRRGEIIIHLRLVVPIYPSPSLPPCSLKIPGISMHGKRKYILLLSFLLVSYSLLGVTYVLPRNKA